jgi:hypothetical protein
MKTFSNTEACLKKGSDTYEPKVKFESSFEDLIDYLRQVQG